MKLPFTIDQFTSLLRSYNLAVWPMQIVLYGIALGMLLLLLRKSSASSRIICAGLAFLWGWTGIAYHLAFFTGINPAAKFFGLLCIGQSVLVLVFGVLRTTFNFNARSGNIHSSIGILLIAYALVIYPLLGAGFGHIYPEAPTFGLPCPTTIFTVGLFFLAFPATRWFLVIIPLVWTIIGGSAAFKLGIYEDYGLLISGLLLSFLFFSRRGSGTDTGLKNRTLHPERNI